MRTQLLLKNLNNVANINVKPSAYNSEKDLIKDILNKKADVAYENRQVAYEPEKHKDPDESDKPYRQRSRAARMRDPKSCLLYTSPSPRDGLLSRMPSSA